MLPCLKPFKGWNHAHHDIFHDLGFRYLKHFY